MTSRNVPCCCIKQDRKHKNCSTHYTGDDYATAVAKLDEYFLPKKNVDYETFQFRQATQQTGETLDQFVTRLRKLAAHCEFTDLNKELKSAIIQNCQSKRLRRFGLREEDMTLEKLLAKARALEGSERQASGIEHSLPSEKVNQIQSFSSKFQQRNSRTPQQAGFSSRQPFSKSYQQPQRPFTQQQPQDTRQSSQCRKCGLAWPHTRGPCPAQGQVCHKCNKPNHFARMCLAPQQPDTSEKNQQPEQKRPFNQQRQSVQCVED